MKRSTFIVSGAAIVAGSVNPALAAAPNRNVVLTAADDVRVYGVERAPLMRPAGVVLLFHQAMSSADEYDPIAPRLVAMEYATLAIDQRSGGNLYGRNRTVAALGQSQSFLAVGHDIDAAIAWSRKTYPGVPTILWGSSYSASLIFIAAAAHPGKVAKLLAFSPGEYFSEEYFEGQAAVARAAERIAVPIFVDSAADRDEIEAAKAILAASPAKLKVQYVPKHGIHGSSTLRPDKDPAGYEENWRAVEAFLQATAA